MFAGRTAAYFKDLIVGKEEFLRPLFESSIKVNSANYIGDTKVLKLEIENVSNAKLLLDNESMYSFHAHADIVEIPAKGKVNLEVKTLESKEEILLEFQVLNGITAPNQHPSIELKVKLD